MYAMLRPGGLVASLSITFKKAQYFSRKLKKKEIKTIEKKIEKHYSFLKT